eukprot:SAG31_NODE_719_length_12605_cov_22.378858_6_plen_157_part_00
MVTDIVETVVVDCGWKVNERQAAIMEVGKLLNTKRARGWFPTGMQRVRQREIGGVGPGCSHRGRIRCAASSPQHAKAGAAGRPQRPAAAASALPSCNGDPASLSPVSAAGPRPGSYALPSVPTASAMAVVCAARVPRRARAPRRACRPSTHINMSY